MVEFKDQKEYEYMWTHGGKTIDWKDKVDMKDALAVSDAPAWIPKTLNNQIAEAIEPMLIGTTLLQRITFQPGQFITFPVASALEGDFDMGEGEEYPEVKVQIAPGTVITSIGKTGAAVKFTDEILRYASFDVISLHVRQLGRALARHKEEKIFKLVMNEGTVTHDNLTPTNSIYGATRGRSLSGAANGSLTMDDLFEAFAQVMNQGFIPNMLLMHPLTWLMFVQDPVLRAFALQNGGGTFFAGWNGNPAVLDPFPNQFNGMGISQGRYATQPGAANSTTTAVEAFSQLMTSSPTLPNYGFGAFTIVVSPFVPFDPQTNTTTIMMADRSELGFYIVDEDLMVEEIRDPYRDILKVKMRERYTLAIKNSGFGIGVLKNVYVRPNEIVLPARSYVAVANSVLGPLSRNTAPTP